MIEDIHDLTTAAFVFDLTTYSFLDVNQAAIMLYGYSCEEFKKMKIFELRSLDQR